MILESSNAIGGPLVAVVLGLGAGGSLLVLLFGAGFETAALEGVELGFTEESEAVETVREDDALEAEVGSAPAVDVGAGIPTDAASAAASSISLLFLFSLSPGPSHTIPLLSHSPQNLDEDAEGAQRNFRVRQNVQAS